MYRAGNVPADSPQSILPVFPKGQTDQIRGTEQGWILLIVIALYLPFRQRRGQHDLRRHRLPAEGTQIRPPPLGLPPSAPTLGVISIQYSWNEHFAR